MLEHASFQPDAGERYFPIGMVKYRNRAQKCCELPSLEKFRIRRDKALSNLI